MFLSTPTLLNLQTPDSVNYKYPMHPPNSAGHSTSQHSFNCCEPTSWFALPPLSTLTCRHTTSFDSIISFVWRLQIQRHDDGIHEEDRDDIPKQTTLVWGVSCQKNCVLRIKLKQIEILIHSLTCIFLFVTILLLSHRSVHFAHTIPE